MSTHIIATFKSKSWDEAPYSEIEGGPGLVRASVVNDYRGDIEGEGTLEYLMIYHANGTADSIGIERIVGKLGDRAGSFVLQQSGIYADGTAKATLFVVPGSGTGDLRGLRGEGSFVATHEPPGTLTLDYYFDQ